MAKVFRIADGSYKGTKTEVGGVCIVSVMEKEEEEVVMSVVKAVTAVVTTIKTT